MQAYTDEELDNPIRVLANFAAQNMGAAAATLGVGKIAEAMGASGRTLRMINALALSAQNAGGVYNTPRYLQAQTLALRELQNGQVDPRYVETRVKEILAGKNVDAAEQRRMEAWSLLAAGLAAGGAYAASEALGKLRAAIESRGPISQSLIDNV